MHFQVQPLIAQEYWKLNLSPIISQTKAQCFISGRIHDEFAEEHPVKLYFVVLNVVIAMFQQKTKSAETLLKHCLRSACAVIQRF